LIEWYKTHHEKQNFELVFVSSDRDLPSFKAYAGHFPFPSIPYEDRASKQKLSALYGITGIPALIVVDKNGALVTKNGREGVSLHPEAFPWPAKTLVEELAGSLLGPGGVVIPDAVAHFKGKKVALYFSASWCGPCKKFSPLLAGCYDAVKKAGKGFEVVFVSADRDAGFIYFKKKRFCFVVKKYEQSRSILILVTCLGLLFLSAMLGSRG
jgi:nucleoredoxin